MADQIFQVNSSSFQDVEVSASLRAGPSIIVDFHQASTVTGSFSGHGGSLTNLSASYIIATPATTASWANNALTTSFVTSSNVFGTVGNAISASNSITSSWANNFPKELATGSSFQITASISTTASWAQNGMITNSLYPVTSSNSVTASFANIAASLLLTANISITSLTASSGILVGPSSNNTASFYISGSPGKRIMEVDNSVGRDIFIIHSSGTTEIASGSLTGSLQGTASYAFTSSYNNNVVIAAVSGSDIVLTGTLSARSLPLSFSVGVNETWIAQVDTSILPSNNRGCRYVISSSAGPNIGGNLQGWVMGSSTIANPVGAQFTAYNTLDAVNIHASAGVETPARIWFTITNPATASLICLAIAVTNTGDTATLRAGSYMVARKVV